MDDSDTKELRNLRKPYDHLKKEALSYSPPGTSSDYGGVCAVANGSSDSKYIREKVGSPAHYNRVVRQRSGYMLTITSCH